MELSGGVVEGKRAQVVTKMGGVIYTEGEREPSEHRRLYK
jgi:hypothetical protein